MNPRLNVVNDQIADDITSRKLPPTVPISKRELPSLPVSKTKLIQNQSIDSHSPRLSSIYIEEEKETDIFSRIYPSHNTRNINYSFSPPASSPTSRRSSFKSYVTSNSAPSTPKTHISHSISVLSSSRSSTSSFGSLGRASFRSLFSNIKSLKTKKTSNASHDCLPTKKTSLFQSKSVDSKVNPKHRKYMSVIDGCVDEYKYNQISRWRPSIQFIYSDDEILETLVTFMTRQYNEENILFLKAVRTLNANINFLLVRNATETEKIQLDIIAIYDRYIKTHAEKQINLSFQCNNEIMRTFGQFAQYTLEEKMEMFNVCVTEIETLIHTSVLGRFYMSESFQCIARNRNRFTNDIVQSKNSFFDYCDKIGTNKYLVSTKGYSEGCHEWEIEIVKCNNHRQEFGIISNFDKSVKINDFGLCETPLCGARAVYGYNHLNNSFYYASYNKNNTLRCNKNLSQLSIHKNKLCKGDIIKICLNLDKGNVKFYLNNKQIRKSVSIQVSTYYPIIVYSGDSQYRVIRG